ncbi:FxsA family protein [Neorhizobium sp. NPDC001467]|uniref:FxsA family protein n=1 Tax=Neorhizobium sp. NPDC001467 TaxID=3390595 RepID=UPI003CFE81AA
MPIILLPIIFLGLPLIEIAGFVLVGKTIGLWWTLALVILTSLAGIVLLRNQGLSMLRNATRESQEGRLPGKSLVSGAMVVIAGVLLILPGFFTDIIGLLLFIPAVRHLLWSLIGKRVVVMRTARGTSATYRSENPQHTKHASEPTVLDLDERDFHRAPNTSSPWSDPDNRKD